MTTFDDYVRATSEPGTDPYHEPPCQKYESRTQARLREIVALNDRMLKLKVTGDGHRDRLVAAKLQVRRGTDD